MKTNKVILNNEVLIDLTADTITVSDVKKGVTFHGKDGIEYSGEYEVVLQSKHVMPNDEQQIISADDAYEGLSEVTVGAVPTEEKTVTTNGDVTPTDGKYLSKVIIDIPTWDQNKTSTAVAPLLYEEGIGPTGIYVLNDIMETLGAFCAKQRQRKYVTKMEIWVPFISGGRPFRGMVYSCTQNDLVEVASREVLLFDPADDGDSVGFSIDNDTNLDQSQFGPWFLSTKAFDEYLEQNPNATVRNPDFLTDDAVVIDGDEHFETYRVLDFGSIEDQRARAASWGVIVEYSDEGFLEWLNQNSKRTSTAIQYGREMLVSDPNMFVTLHTKDKILSEDILVYSSSSSLPEWDGSYSEMLPMSFYIDEVEYQADEGMTWAEWLVSDYNVDGYEVINDTSVGLTTNPFNSESNNPVCISLTDSAEYLITTCDVINTDGLYSLAEIV